MAFDVPDPNTPPESEPLKFHAGETVKWNRTDLADYPASTYTLYYTLVKDGTRITFNSSQDGSTENHSITLAHGTTAGYAVGVYHWTVEARSSSEVFVVDKGIMEVLVDFAEQSSGSDQRTVAKKMVDAYESLFTNQITNKTIEQLSYSIGGRSISKLSAEQIRLEYFRWVRIYKAELDEERIQNGLGTRKRILTRFS